MPSPHVTQNIASPGLFVRTMMIVHYVYEILSSAASITLVTWDGTGAFFFVKMEEILIVLVSSPAK